MSKVTFNTRSSGVTLKGVSKLYPSLDGGADFAAVKDLDLTINDGEMVTLLGPSGCGKTTTLRMISGFETPTKGEVLIGERVVNDIPANKRDISMVFQSYALFPHMTIFENIAYGLRVKRLPKEEIRERTGAAVDLMQLTGMEERYPNQLSGGQQQRVALARAVVIEPRVLLFDEPLSNLDAKLRETMRDELRAIQQRLGITSLYVTHDQAEAMAISDQVVIMDRGMVAQMGTPQEIYEYPVSKFVANFIGRANFMGGRLASAEGGRAVVEIDGLKLALEHPGIALPQAGEACSVTFRPESVSLDTEGEGIACRVERAVYFGSKMEYEVETRQGRIIAEIYNPQTTVRYHVGDMVKLKINLDCARVLKEETT